MRSSCSWDRLNDVAFTLIDQIQAVFSFLYLKKIKILKIYAGFGKFQKYTPVALWGDRAQM